MSSPISQILWLFAEKLLRLLLGTALTLLVARILGPAAFGVYSYLFAILALLLAVAALGLKDVMVDEIASGRLETDSAFTTAALMQFVAGVILFLLFMVYAAVAYGFGSNEFWAAALIGAALLLKGGDAVLFMMEAQSKLRSVAFANALSVIAGSIGRIVLLLVGATLVSFSFVLFVEYAVLFAILIWIARSEVLSFSLKKYRWDHVSLLLSRSWPLLVSSVSVISYFYIDQIMLAFLLDHEAAGIYAAASRISQQLYVIPVILVTAYFPRLTVINGQSTDEFEGGMVALMLWLILLAIGVIGGVFLFADLVVDLLLGSDYAGTAQTLKIHSISLVLASINVLAARWYVINNLQILSLARQVMTAIINIALNFVLIPTYGVIGSAFATLIALAFLAFGFDGLTKPTRRLLHLKFVAIRSLFSIRRIRDAAHRLLSI